MEFKILPILFFVFFLYLINFYLKKFNYCLDKISNKEKHKSLLSLNKLVPLSGSFYFFPIIFFLFYQFELVVSIFCLFFFTLGLMSDLKITNSPKLRLAIQFFFLLIFLYINNNIIIDTRIDNLNYIMNNNISRIIIISFFFLVLINGFNFIDGVNNLSSLNFLIILIFIYLLLGNIGIAKFNNEILILIIALSIFVIFNFFGENFLGDGGAYGLSFLIGYIVIKITLLDQNISPYFIANLLWYPAFENLFTIVKRTIYKKKHYLPDNEHLHQMFYKYLKKKNFIKKKYLLSSLTGILINIYLFVIFFIGYIFYSKTNIQIFLIIMNTSLYIMFYQLLKKNYK